MGHHSAAADGGKPFFRPGSILLWSRHWRRSRVQVYTQACGRGETGRRNGLERLECPAGNIRCRTAQIRGTLSDGDPEPSPSLLSRGEGVETRRAAPKVGHDYGEGIVQTTNRPPGPITGDRGDESRSGTKIRRGDPCRFDSGRPHQSGSHVHRLVRDPLSLRFRSLPGYSIIVRRADRDVGGHEPVSTFTRMATRSGRGWGGRSPMVSPGRHEAGSFLDPAQGFPLV